MAIETIVMENGGDAPAEAAARTAQADGAIIAMLRELLFEQRDVITRLLEHQQQQHQHQQQHARSTTPTDPGPAAELIEQYRRIQRALALID